ncbi:alpha/beta hydrolase [Dermatobacter hominis]|uniref:alpha/beta hydrolase n=1 Tax=Dermatobacter hominis TaxID=2884263 RepID=UPI001D10D65A|nr:alpha/beta hydrolase [Dermatobacter hominis]UDY34846.1 alpha/beta hydrolase [Dermatobacter hominis]
MATSANRATAHDHTGAPVGTAPRPTQAPPAAARRRGRVALVAGAVALAVLSSACGMANVADPRLADLLSPDWGEDLPASRADVAYGPDRGCGPDATDDEPCGGSQTLDIYRAGVRAPSPTTSTTTPTDPLDPDAGSPADDHDGTAGPGGPDASTTTTPAPGGPRRGTIVFVHGGGFSAGDKSRLESFAPILRQTQRGWDVVVVNYRLSNRWLGTDMYPTPLLDVERALDWVRHQGPGQGLDTSHVVVAGESAGAGLAALIGTAWNSGRPELAGIDRVDGYVSIAGVLDLDTATSRFWSSLWIPDLLMLPVVSATSYLDAADPPAWLLHGDLDPVVESTGSQHFKAIADRGGFGHLVDFDLVDMAADGSPIDPGLRHHAPGGGANAPALDAWLDRIAG